MLPLYNDNLFLHVREMGPITKNTVVKTNLYNFIILSMHLYIDMHANGL